MIVYKDSKEYWSLLRKLEGTDKIFANGVFDIVHLGHLSIIEEAKDLKDIMPNKRPIIFGINSDESTLSLNKSHGIINTETERALFLKKIGVDHVIIFDDTNPVSLIREILPKFVIKGSDYKNKFYIEKEVLMEMDALISYVNLEEGYSTTNIIERVKEDLKKRSLLEEGN